MDDSEKLSGKIFYWVKVDYSLEVELCCSENITYLYDSIVVLETRHGLELGKISGKSLPLSTINSNIDSYIRIIRQATDEDLEVRENNKKRVPESSRIFNEKVKEYNLPLKLLNVHHFLDDKKAMFYFYCENRVDFRNFVRELASIFKVRIELRQVGVRDEAMFMGGYGICGRQFCCTQFGTNKDPKSIKMAREQNLTLNSMRISGVCGRLLCCLNFEYDYYQAKSLDSIKLYSDIIINNDKVAKIIKIDKEKGILTIKIINNSEKYHIPVESLLINSKTGQYYTFL